MRTLFIFTALFFSLALGIMLNEGANLRQRGTEAHWFVGTKHSGFQNSIREIYLFNPVNNFQQELTQNSNSGTLYRSIYQKNTILLTDHDLNGIHQLYSFNLVSHRRTQLTHLKYSVRPIYLSKDETWLYFITVNQNPASELYRLNMQTLDVEQLTNNDFYETCLIWSHDEEMIAYLDDRSPNKLYVMNADGSNVQFLTESMNIDHPRFSSDRTWIYYWQATEAEPDSDGFWIGDIYRFEIATKKNQNLTHHPAKDGMDLLSPDGKWLIFGSDRSNASIDLYRMSVDNLYVEQLTSSSGRNSFARFSPDGKWIIYYTHSGVSGTPYNLARMKSDGSNQQQLTDTQEYFSLIRITDDSRYLYVMNYDYSTTNRLEHFDLETGEMLHSWSTDIDYILSDQITIDKEWHPQQLTIGWVMLLISAIFVRSSLPNLIFK